MSKGWKNKFFEFNKEILRNKYVILKYRGDAVNLGPLKSSQFLMLHKHGDVASLCSLLAGTLARL